jgi:integrase
MKLTPPITLKSLRNLQVGEELADGACRGLRARAREKGVVWSLLVTDGRGKKKRIDLGPWPEVGITEAHALAEAARAEARRGTGPVGRLTLGDVLALYEQEGPALENASWEKLARGAIARVFDAVLDERAGELTSAALLRAADGYRYRSSADAALRYLRPALHWAERRSYVPKGLWSDLAGVPQTEARERVLSEAELGLVLRELGTTGYDGAARMMLYTACRREEVCGMRFEDIIEDVWYVPGDLRKYGKPHVVPLSQQAQRVIGAQGRVSGFVFLGKKGGVLSSSKKSNWDRWQKQFFKRSGTEGWTRHDLRRTAATLMGNNGVLPAIVEIVLGHSEPHSDLAGVYNKSRYAREHAEALKTLGDVLQGIEIRAQRAWAGG